MFKVGITGGIGSGKSTVSKIFEILGIPVYYADEAAKQLMNDNAALKESIQKHFSTDSYSNELLNREWLAAQVFNNAEKLALLNSLVHPVTIKDANEWMSRQSTPYAIKEAALIFESGTQSHLDYIVGVYAPEVVRMQRVMKRDGSNKEAVQKRMQRQIDETIKMRLCDAVIINDGREALITQVVKLHQQILSQCRL